jgi:hypothetical protein
MVSVFHWHRYANAALSLLHIGASGEVYLFTCFDFRFIWIIFRFSIKTNMNFFPVNRRTSILHPLSSLLIILSIILTCNSCIRLPGKGLNLGVCTVTFSGYMKNAYNTQTGHTYVSYHVSFVAYYYNGNTRFEYDRQSITMPASTSTPQVVISTHLPTNFPWEIHCTIDATQCSLAAVPDYCNVWHTPDGNGGEYSGIPGYDFGNNASVGYSPTLTLTAFIQTPNLSCGCIVPH